MQPTYKIIGGDGKEYGPVSLEEMAAWVREGRVVAHTQVQRADQNVWQPGSSFPELGLGLAAEAPAPAVPAGGALPATGAEASVLENQFKSGASWFYWIAGLSVINSVATLSGSGWGFVVGLGVTQIIDHVARSAGSSAMIVAGVLDLLAAGLFVLFGWLANRRQGWSFVVGMVLYGLDGLIFLLVRDWLALGFHAFALYCLFKGYQALRRLQAGG